MVLAIARRYGSKLNRVHLVVKAPGDRLRHGLSVAGLIAMTLATHGAFVQGQAQPPLPARFHSYINSDVKLTAEEQPQLVAGQPVTKLLDADPSKEVAIFGAVWVKAPIARYVTAVKDIEEFEKGDNFLTSRPTSWWLQRCCTRATISGRPSNCAS